jgi:hypothetical protein
MKPIAATAMAISVVVSASAWADEGGLEARRAEASRRDRIATRGVRDAHDVALDADVSGAPIASSSAAGSSPLEALDADPTTAWRGAPGQSMWTWTLPFRRVVHLGLVRAHFGDAPTRGVPAEYRWEIQRPVEGRCEAWRPWEMARDARREDRDGNVFAHGSKEIHAQHQALFADEDACGLRLVVTAVDDGAPVVREVRVVEGARSVSREAIATASEGAPALPHTSPAGLVDGTYEEAWSGTPGAASWTVDLRLPRARTLDRLKLVLGEDAVTVKRASGPGRLFSGGYLPLEYTVLASYDDDEAHLSPIAEAEPPREGVVALPVRRRLVHFAPRVVRRVRISIRRATARWGEIDRSGEAPVIREVGLYEADDPRPVVEPPAFLSVNANPAGLIALAKGGEAYTDGTFARDAYHRLRRIVVGFDTDTRWPADASRPRDRGTGRFLEAIEGDDPLLASVVAATSPPPVVMLSGAKDWEFSDVTAPWPGSKTLWGWDVTSDADSPGRGMGRLGPLVRARAVPFLGFCGGAQILALLAANAPLDDVLMRNANNRIRGLLTVKKPYERAWWSDPAELDDERPTISFDPFDPLFDVAEPGPRRTSTRELPSLHGDVIRPSAFARLLVDQRVVATSTFCRPWVEEGLEPTTPSPEARCITVPQAFRTTDPTKQPILGFQFHPEQRDLTRLAPGSPPEARADALAVFSNAIALVLDAYVRLYLPGALGRS